VPLQEAEQTVECRVSTPPSTRKAALALAGGQAAYCADIVDQGWGSVSHLGASLLSAERWYFWWD
jgi:hypothetical protein